MIFETLFGLRVEIGSMVLSLSSQRWLEESSAAVEELRLDGYEVEFSARKKKEDTAELVEQQNRVLAEIVSSEEYYVKCVACLVDVVQACVDSQFGNGGPILPGNQVMTIFSNVEDILLVNRELLMQLKQKNRISDIFLNISFVLRLYSRYIANFDAARQCLEDARAGTPRFDELVSRPNAAGQSIESLMIMPVQRIPRYELLLRDLLRVSKKMVSPDEDVEELENCIEAIRDVAQANNELIRLTESKAILYDIQKRFAMKPPLVGPGISPRYFVKEGILRKVHGRGGSQVQCHLILLSDMLLYAVESKLHRRVWLADSATQFVDGEIGDASFAVLNSEKSMTFLCVQGEGDDDDGVPPAVAKDQWLRSLRETQAEEFRRRETCEQKRDGASGDNSSCSLSSREGVAMSLWQQDTPQCAVTRVKFTTLIRRHHCRVNGECVSADASKARANLKELGQRFSNTEERVCDWCCRDYTLCGESWARVVKEKDDLREAISRKEGAKRLDYQRARILGSWIWKKGGGSVEKKNGIFSGRRNWKKRWLELRRRRDDTQFPFELCYFESFDGIDRKGRLSLKNATLLTFHDHTSFVVQSANRDYHMRFHQIVPPEDYAMTDAEKGHFALWVAAISECIARSKKAPSASSSLPPSSCAATATMACAEEEEEEDWYWQDANGEQRGPSSLSEVRNALKNRDLLETCHVFCGRVTKDWVLVSDLRARGTVMNL